MDISLTAASSRHGNTSTYALSHSEPICLVYLKLNLRPISSLKITRSVLAQQFLH